MWDGLRLAVHLAAGGLVEARAQSHFADRFQNADRADGGDVRSVFRNFETDAHVALRGQMINFVRLQLVQEFNEVDRITKVAHVQKKPHAVDVGVGVKMIDAGSVEGARPPHDAMNFVAFLEQ